MSLDIGTQFSFYQVLGPLGAGGMGEVYRATDTKLKREVALKVLPADFSTDAERLARFQREAELLAALNHPGIAQIYGLEQANGVTALVMELIDGPTLAARIEQGPLPSDDALNIALQIADALEAAHERGIVHRDLKPANIKLKLDGRVKVLDFGIAKAVDPALHSSGPVSPQLTTPAMTQSGMILGTAAYMSPEQARGKPVDRRTDIWAFGCVLYEMLSGQPAFGGEDVQETIARVITNKLDLKLLPKAVPQALQQTIELCLEKDPKKRLADFSDVRLALRGRFEMTALTVAASSRLPWLAGTAAAIVLAAFAGWRLHPQSKPDLTLNRFAHVLPDSQELRTSTRNLLAVSPDGRRFAYTTTEGLMVRELNELEAHLIPGVEAATFTPVFSPDGHSVAYFSSATADLRRIPITGGVPAIISSGNVAMPHDMSWGIDDTIFYAQSDGIWRVPATGGAPELVVAAKGLGGLADAELLSDGDTLLFSVQPSGNQDFDRANIVAQSLATGVRTVLIQGGSDPHYVSTGHLVYGSGEALFAIAFDPSTLTTSGSPVALVQDALRSISTSNYGVSDSGTLMYLNSAARVLNTLAWVARDGTETPIPFDPALISYPRLAPDGTQVAVGASGNNYIYVWDFAAETRLLLNVGEAASGGYAAWTADSARIAYIGSNNGIDWRAANNTGESSPVSAFVSNGTEWPTPYFFTPSGKELVFRNQATPGTGDDIAMITVGDSATEPTWLLRGPYVERNAVLSPNGRWMAYDSNESGREEVYVRPFPDVDADRVQVSNAGGAKPLWSPDGTELFYLQPDATGTRTQLLSAAVTTGDAKFSFGTRRVMFDWPYLANVEGRTYDIAADGQRFIVVKPMVNPEQADTPIQVVIIQNWAEELKRLVPVE